MAIPNLICKNTLKKDKERNNHSFIRLDDFSLLGLLLLSYLLHLDVAGIGLIFACLSAKLWVFRNTVTLLILHVWVFADDILLEMIVDSNLTLCEHIEDLLNSCLLQRVFRNLEFLLMGFELTEDLADGDSRIDSEAVKIRQMLNDIELSETLKKIVRLRGW